MSFYEFVNKSWLKLWGKPISEFDFEQILFFMDGCLYDLVHDPDFDGTFTSGDLVYYVSKNGMSWPSDGHVLDFLAFFVEFSDVIIVDDDGNCCLTPEMYEALKVDLF